MPSRPPCLAIDAMGGDFGPSVLVPGALHAARQRRLSLRFVGKDSEIRAELEKNQLNGLDVEIIHAEDVAEMGDKPSHILRRKKHTSIKLACDLVKDGEADGVISAGHTGVSLASGIFTLGRIKGIERPGLATFLPREKKPLILIDVGANVDSKPRHLVQFAIMAESLARNVLKVEDPQIGILNIGDEQGKGNLQVSEAYDLLKKTSLNFIGNVEGRDLFKADLDIAVCDGFVGNVALKLSEGLGKAFSSMLRKELKRGFFAKVGSLLAMSAFKRFIRRLDYEEYGGAPLLGLNGSIFVCHGSAGEKAISKTADMAATFIVSKANDDIKHGLELNPEITRFHRLRNILHTSTSKSQHGEEEAEAEKE